MQQKQLSEESSQHKCLLHEEKKNKKQHSNNFISYDTRKRKTMSKIRRKEVTKIRTEINKIETKKISEKVSENKSRFFEKINKMEKPLVRLTNRREKVLK